MVEQDSEDTLKLTGENVGPPLKFKELIPSVLIAVFGAVLSIVVLSWLLVDLFPRLRFTTVPLEVSERAQACAPNERVGNLLQLNCGGQPVIAMVAGAVPVADAPFADSSAAFRDGIDDFLTVSKFMGGECKVFDIAGTGAGIPLASCSSGELSMPRLLVATGRADLDREEVVAAVMGAEGGLAQERAWAIAERLGLRDDAAAAAAARREAAQGWLATIVGVCAAIGVYVANSRRRLEVIGTKFTAKISEFENELHKFTRGETHEVEPLHKALKGLRTYLELTRSRKDDSVPKLTDEIDSLIEVSKTLSKSPSISRNAFSKSAVELAEGIRDYALKRTP